jgi:hypothetical protein
MTDTFAVIYTDQNINGTYTKDGTLSYYMNANKLAKIEQNDSKEYHVFTRPNTTVNNWDDWNVKIKLVKGTGEDYTGTWWSLKEKPPKKDGVVAGFTATRRQVTVPEVKAVDPVVPVVPLGVPLVVQPVGSSGDLTQYKTEASQALRQALSDKQTALDHKEATSAAKKRVENAKAAVDAVKTRVQNANALVAGVSTEVDIVTNHVGQATTAEQTANSAYNNAVSAYTAVEAAVASANAAVTSARAMDAANKAKEEAAQAQTAKEAAGNAKRDAERYASSAEAAVGRATAIAAAQPPAANESRTTLPCEALAGLVGPNDASIVVCAPTGTSSSVSIKRDDENPVSVVVYKRNTGEWGGYGPIDTQVLKGVYVLIDPTKKTVTCVWQYDKTPRHETIVYEARLIESRARAYALTQTHPAAAAAAQPTVSITVSQELADSLPVPTQEQMDAVACAALGRKFTGETLQCTPPVDADVAIVTVTKSAGFTAHFKMYKYTQPASFWAGYGRAGVANSGVYVKISSTGDVTCVWDSGASGQKVEYKSERVPSTSTSPVPVVYTLKSGTDNVTLVHKSGQSPFPTRTQEEVAEDKKKEAGLAGATAAACNELKKKLDWVVCDSTGPVTSDVMVMRGTAAGVLVTLHYNSTSKSWTGYGLSTGSAGTGPKGLYVAVSTDAQGVAVVKCVWDTNVPEVGDYRAVQDRTARVYALVAVSPTSVVKDTVSVLVTSDQSPFPSEKETPKPVASAPAPSSLSTEAIIGIVVGSVVGFILIVVLVVLWVRSRKAHGQPTNWNNFQL